MPRRLGGFVAAAAGTAAVLDDVLMVACEIVVVAVVGVAAFDMAEVAVHIAPMHLQPRHHPRA